MTRKLTPDQLDEIEEAALAAMDSIRSLGRWTAAHDCVDDFHTGKVAQAQGSPRVAQHIAMMDPDTTFDLVAEVRELRAKVERVREIIDGPDYAEAQLALIDEALGEEA